MFAHFQHGGHESEVVISYHMHRISLLTKEDIFVKFRARSSCTEWSCNSV